MHFKVFTLFPELFPGPLKASIIGKALDNELWQCEAINIRDYATDKHRTVDDIVYGGGPGMVMRADVVDAALRAHFQAKKPRTLLYLTPRGTPLKQSRVKELAHCSTIGLLCGRFEGIDQRVIDDWCIEEVSIGDFVLSGGELAAMMLMDSVLRLLPGVIGSPESLDEESFNEDLLEYPQYTRPADWNGMKVPEELISGNHALIRKWRRQQAEKITSLRRPDLWKQYCEKSKGLGKGES